MFLSLSYLLGALLFASAVYALVLVVRARPIDNPMFYLLAASELATLLTLVAGVLGWSAAAPTMDKGVFVAYLVGMLLALPAATAWAFADRQTRWGTGVLVISALGLGIMTIRLVQLWHGHA